MNICQIKCRAREFLACSAVLFAAGSVFLRPETAMEGVTRGLSLCCSTIIPTLFPFLVLSQLILEGPAASVLGLFLLPYTRLLGIKSRKAPSALLCGILGGFAAGARGIDTLYRSKDLSAVQAQRLLVCTIGSGPAFVVGSVGSAMLGSGHAGWLLLVSQLCASLLCGILLRSKAPGEPAKEPRPQEAAPLGRGFAHAVSHAVSSVALLCGYITLFSFFSAIVVPPKANSLLRFAAAFPLEVTSACYAGAGTALPLFLCSAALSAMGASVFLQVRALLSPDVSIRPLFFSRFLHLPAAASLLFILLKLFPVAQPAAAPLWPSVVAARMPADAICVVFVLCALAFGGRAPTSGLRQRPKGV